MNHPPSNQRIIHPNPELSGQPKHKTFSEGKTFTSRPKIRRRHTGNRSVYRTAHNLVDYFFPKLIVSYEELEERLVCALGRTSPPTVLRYLGRPESKEIKKWEHEKVSYNSGKVSHESHLWKRKLSQKEGLIEKLGLAEMVRNPKNGKVFFNLFHQRQTTFDAVPPPLSTPHPRGHVEERSCVGLTLDEPDFRRNQAISPKKNLSLLLGGECACEPNDDSANVCSSVIDGEEREYSKRKKNQQHEHKRIQTCVGKDKTSVKLTDEERRLFRIYEESAK